MIACDALGLSYSIGRAYNLTMNQMPHVADEILREIDQQLLNLESGNYDQELSSQADATKWAKEILDNLAGDAAEEAWLKGNLAAGLPIPPAMSDNITQNRMRLISLLREVRAEVVSRRPVTTPPANTKRGRGVAHYPRFCGSGYC